MTTTFNTIGTVAIAVALCLMTGWTGIWLIAVIGGFIGVVRA